MDAKRRRQHQPGSCRRAGGCLLNNVMRQYFANQPISTTFLGSHFAGQKRPKLVTETAAKNLVRNLFQGGQLAGLDFPNTVVCLMLPSGTVLTDGTGPGGERERDEGNEKPGTPEEEEASSLEGLGGFHGSVDVGSTLCGRVFTRTDQQKMASSGWEGENVRLPSLEAGDLGSALVRPFPC